MPVRVKGRQRVPSPHVNGTAYGDEHVQKFPSFNSADRVLRQRNKMMTGRRERPVGGS